MANCTLLLVKIFRKPSKVRKSCKGCSYITLKVLSNKKEVNFQVNFYCNIPLRKNNLELLETFSTNKVKVSLLLSLLSLVEAPVSKIKKEILLLIHHLVMETSQV